ncbi:MAG: flagellar M-ring protein FliF [Kiritimatiellia bacterium]
MTDYLLKAWIFYSKLQPQRQTQLWLGLVGAIVTIVGLSWWMTQEPYAQVAAGADVHKAASALRAADIPTRYDGVHLSVPQAQSGDALGVLFSANLSHTFADVADVPMGVGPKVQQWGMLRQKAGDLARSISTMSGVERAAVELEPGEDALFAGEDTGATASVYLMLTPGVNFTPGNVAAVQSTVAGTMGRLSPAQVTVTDNRGRVLADGKSAGSAAHIVNDAIVAFKETYQEQIEAKVRAALRPYVGFENALVVTALVEVDTTSQTINALDYNVSKVFAGEEKIDEMKKENGVTDGGAAGVTAELPERQTDAPAPGGGLKKEDRNRITTKNIAPSTKTLTNIPAGKLVRASVAVSLDQTKLATFWGVEPGSDAYAEKQVLLENVAKAAMGFSEERGDRLELSGALPFAPIETVEAPAVDVKGTLSLISPFVPYGIALVALVLAFMFVVRPLMAKVSEAPIPKITDSSVLLGPDGKPRQISGGDVDLAERLHRLVENFQPVDSDDLNSLVAQQSTASAQVVRNWARES